MIADRVLERLQALPRQYIGAFLLSRGWRLEDQRDEGDHWVLVDAVRERYGSVLVPSNAVDDAGWRAARLHVLAEEIEELEHLSPEALVALLGEAGRDTLRVRVVAPQTTAGELPLGYAAEFVSGVVVMVEAAARATYRPQRRYQTGRQPAVVREFMHAARLGQTEIGSYVVTVHAPLPPEQLTLDETSVATLPFARQAVMTLEHALSAAYDLTETDEPAEDALLDAVDLGLTQNLMGALSRLRTDEVQACAEVSISWSPAYGGRAPLRRNFEPQRLTRLDRISQELDAEPEEPGYELVGLVEGVRYVSTLDAVGRVTIRAKVHDRERIVHVDVQDEHDYQRLGDAHIQRRVVRLKGRLVPGGRRFVSLDDPEVISA